MAFPSCGNCIQHHPHELRFLRRTGQDNCLASDNLYCTYKHKPAYNVRVTRHETGILPPVIRHRKVFDITHHSLTIVTCRPWLNTQVPRYLKLRRQVACMLSWPLLVSSAPYRKWPNVGRKCVSRTMRKCPDLAGPSLCQNTSCMT